MKFALALRLITLVSAVSVSAGRTSAADADEQNNLAPDPKHAALLSEMRQRFATLRTAAR